MDLWWDESEFLTDNMCAEFLRSCSLIRRSEEWGICGLCDCVRIVEQRSAYWSTGRKKFYHYPLSSFLLFPKYRDIIFKKVLAHTRNLLTKIDAVLNTDLWFIEAVISIETSLLLWCYLLQGVLSYRKSDSWLWCIVLTRVAKLRLHYIWSSYSIAKTISLWWMSSHCAQNRSDRVCLCLVSGKSLASLE